MPFELASQFERLPLLRWRVAQVQVVVQSQAWLEAQAWLVVQVQVQVQVQVVAQVLLAQQAQALPLFHALSFAAYQAQEIPVLQAQ